VLQLGHLPNPQDDVGPLEQRWRQQQADLAQRAPFPDGTSPIEVTPPAIAPLAHAFENRPDIQTAFGDFVWTVSYVNLSTVLSFQKIVVLEGIDERVAGVRLDDPASLFAFCLPGPGTPVAMTATLDLDQRGVTFSSLNPNLRVGQIDLQGGGRIAFQVALGPSFLQIVEYRNRWFIRDGYHRAYALLRAGQTEVPCILIRARNFAETGAGAPVFFRYEVLYADRPPYVKDFLDDAVSVTAAQRATRKVVRFKAEEFNVEI